MDLNDYLGTSHGPCVTYAHVYVECAQAMDPVCLIVGADDGIQVLLNGEVVHLNDANSAQDYFNPDEDVIEGLHLNAGENRLMVKVRDAGEAFSFSARFCDEDGEALPGLSYYLSSQQSVPSDGLWQLY